LNTHRHPPDTQGAALIVVVAFLVLLSVMIVAFYTKVGNDLTISRNYAESANVRQLADSAIGVVMGQIREATTVKQGAWASQPGMIRVYGSEGNPSSAAHAFFKLYSSHDLVVDGPDLRTFAKKQFGEAGAEQVVEVPLGPGGWRDQPAYFTDLNEPARVSAAPTDRAKGRHTVTRYPIFDPSVAALGASADQFERPWQVEGSAIVLPPKLRDTETNSLGNEAPMPVRWIYVLRDGTLTAPIPVANNPGGSKGKIAKWRAISGSKAGVPNKNNPIVGRIAFWADDETSKLNINTAGGFIAPDQADEEKDPVSAMDYAGSYWDTPRLVTAFDRGTLQQSGADMGALLQPSLTNAQPLRNEFQRYPGHPATTSLDVVFRRLLRERIPKTGSPFDSEALYSWLPRLTPGGSRGGTTFVSSRLDRILPIKSPNDLLDYPGYPDLNGRTFHLYDTVDEMLYSPEKTERRLAEEFLKLPPNSITPDLLEQARFFLTPHSRAPELNLFGQPRVTMWPIWDESRGVRPDKARNTAVDSLLRFSSRIGGKEFIFTRRDPLHPRTDFELPGNRALLEYLRRLTSKETGRIPGFGASFEEKLANTPGGRDELLTQIFDYIRTINLKDSSRAALIEASELGDGIKLEETARLMYAPRGLVVPTRAELGGTKVAGMGRFPTISEASIVFYHAGWVGIPKAGLSTQTLIQDPEKLPAFNVSHKLVRAFLVFETVNPMQGYAGTEAPVAKKERVIHRLALPADFTLKSDSMPQAAALGFPREAENQIKVAAGDTWEGRSFGGTEGFFHTMRDKIKAHLWRADRMDPDDRWPKCDYPFRTQFASQGGTFDGVLVPVGDKRFAFSGGEAQLAIVINGHKVQDITLNFPPGSNWPLPTGLTEGERARLNGKMPTIESDDQTPALRHDLGGFIRDHDLAARERKARPAVRREWAFSFERRLAWMVTARESDEEHSYAPWTVDGAHYTNRWRNILQPGDTIRSLIPGSPEQPDLADPRFLASQPELRGVFRPHPDYASSMQRAETLRRGDGEPYFTPSGPSGMLAALPPGKSYPARRAPDLAPGMMARRADGRPADFDTGLGDSPDGGYGGKADEGKEITVRWNPQRKANEIVLPYFERHEFDGTQDDTPESAAYFTPNRQVASAVAFGSLLARNKGWETLLFSPNPAGADHPGLRSPRDHLLLDLFTMPVVEPYAISEPFSTAGKVNLNYEIMPFGYLKRSTALRAALQSVRIPAIPQDRVGEYKTAGEGDQAKMPNVRYLVDRDETLRAFEAFFAEAKNDPSRGFFKSASEICDRFLYPKGPTHAGRVPFRGPLESNLNGHFWANSTLTGDNLREKPYADLYPRLTTKSNTYTVHYRVQTLRQAPFRGQGSEDEHFARWDEERDTQLAEFRGQTTIERYLDPADRRFKAQRGEKFDVQTQSLEDAYRFRIISSKRFTPWQ
jgi:uncharacterized protein (TIGR02600 family)